MTIPLDIPPHPDAEQDWKAFKQMKTAGRQAAEDAAIAEYIKAHEAGLSREECERVHSDIYKKNLYGE